MSGPAIHTLIAQELGKTFRSEGCAAAQAQVDPLEKHVNFRNFGSMGPDFLLFHTGAPEYVGLLLDVVHLSEAIEEQLKRAFELIEPAINTFQTTQDLQQILSDLRFVFAALDSMMVTAGFDLLTDQVDFFNILPNVVQEGVAGPEWGPFDVLHYRRTGEFASRLLEFSRNDPELHAYAIGYLSHYAADVVGHPYVNMLVRGPFREHGQRHKVVENFQDVWAVEKLLQQEFTRSAMHSGLSFPGDQLPDKLSRLVADAYSVTYRGELDDLSSPQQIDNAYRVWYQWYKLSTETGHIPERLPRLQFPITSTIERAWRDFERDVLSSISGGRVSAGSFSPRGLLNFFNRLARAVMSSLFLGAAAVDFLLSGFTGFAREVVHFFLSKIYDELYSAYAHFRESVAFKGLLFPLIRTTRRPVAGHMLNPTLPDAVGRLLSPSDPYPVRRLSANAPLGAEGHLIYPPNNLELPGAPSAPNSYFTEQADFYMSGPLRTDPDLLAQLRRANTPAADSQDIQQLQRVVMDQSLGNALRLTTALYCDWSDGVEGAIPDLNLDADRGLGFPTWEVTRSRGAAEPVPASGTVPVTLLTDEA